MKLSLPLWLFCGVSIQLKLVSYFVEIQQYPLRNESLVETCTKAYVGAAFSLWKKFFLSDVECIIEMCILTGEWSALSSKKFHSILQPYARNWLLETFTVPIFSETLLPLWLFFRGIHIWATWRSGCNAASLWLTLPAWRWRPLSWVCRLWHPGVSSLWNFFWDGINNRKCSFRLVNFVSLVIQAYRPQSRIRPFLWIQLLSFTVPPYWRELFDKRWPWHDAYHQFQACHAAWCTGISHHNTVSTSRVLPNWDPWNLINIGFASEIECFHRYANKKKLFLCLLCDAYM